MRLHCSNQIVIASRSQKTEPSKLSANPMLQVRLISEKYQTEYDSAFVSLGFGAGRVRTMVWGTSGVGGRVCGVVRPDDLQTRSETRYLSPRAFPFKSVRDTVWRFFARFWETKQFTPST